MSGVYAPPVLVQINNYLPFGTRAVGLDYELTNKDQYTYGSKERQDDFGINFHDFEARMSDPTIGNRFWSIDNYAEIFENLTPYNYAQNNPLFYVDPSGDSSVNVNDLNMRTFNVEKDEVQLQEFQVRGERQNSNNSKQAIQNTYNSAQVSLPIPPVRPLEWSCLDGHL